MKLLTDEKLLIDAIVADINIYWKDRLQAERERIVEEIEKAILWVDHDIKTVGTQRSGNKTYTEWQSLKSKIIKGEI